MKYIGFIVAAILLFAFQTSAQTDTSKYDTDELFVVGRELAFNQKRERGRYWLYQALEKSPDYHEIRIFVARTLAWDNKYEEAVKELQYVLSKEKKNKDAILALLDVYNWSDQNEAYLEIADYGLKYYPTNEKFLLATAKALIAMDKKQDAVIILQQLLQLYPANESAKALLEDLKLEFMKNAVSIDYSFDNFSDVYGYQQTQNLTYKRQTKIGSLNLRWNTAQRFDNFGNQLEIDLYPALFKNTYAYVNYGYSNTSLFPKHRAGLEIYRNLPLSMEASLGLRHLDFSGSTVQIYTATLGWYVGNLWISARTYITPDQDVGAVSKSLTLQARRYFSNAQNFVGLRTGYGFSPESELRPNTEVYFFRSRKFILEYQKTIGPRWTLELNGGWADLELPFDPGVFINDWSGSINLEYKF